VGHAKIDDCAFAARQRRAGESALGWRLVTRAGEGSGVMPPLLPKACIGRHKEGFILWRSGSDTVCGLVQRAAAQRPGTAVPDR
jgi:hypothetical protein